MMVITVIVIMKVMGRVRVMMIVIMSNKYGRMKLKVVVISTIISIYIKDDSFRIIIIVIDFFAPTVRQALMEWQLLHYYFQRRFF